MRRAILLTLLALQAAAPAEAAERCGALPGPDLSPSARWVVAETGGRLVACEAPRGRVRVLVDDNLDTDPTEHAVVAAAGRFLLVRVSACMRTPGDCWLRLHRFDLAGRDRFDRAHDIDSPDIAFLSCADACGDAVHTAALSSSGRAAALIEQGGRLRAFAAGPNAAFELDEGPAGSLAAPFARGRRVGWRRGAEQRGALLNRLPRCRPRGRPVAADPGIRLGETEDSDGARVLWGCTDPYGRVRQLADAPDMGLGNSSYSILGRQGRHLITAWDEGNQYGYARGIDVVDVRSGDPYGLFREECYGFTCPPPPSLARYYVDPHGRSATAVVHEGRTEVVAIDARGNRRVLDEGPSGEVSAASLSGKAAIVTWRHGDEERSADLGA